MSNFLVTVSEAARELNLPVRWLKRMIKDGKVPFVRIGRHDRVSIPAVKQAILLLAGESATVEVK